MYAQVEKIKEDKSKVVANSVGRKKKEMKYGDLNSQSDFIVQRKIVGYFKLALIASVVRTFVAGVLVYIISSLIEKYKMSKLQARNDNME